VCALSLRVSIPKSDAEELPVLLHLAQQATVFELDTHAAVPAYTAVFTDVTGSLDQVIRLVGKAVLCPGVRMEIRGRRVASLDRFLSTLLCYQESLAEPNPRDHCLRYSARLNQFSGCPDQTCLRPCQFLCTRCVGLAKDKHGASLEAQLKEFAVQAEVDWCPNLGLSDCLPTSDARRPA